MNYACAYAVTGNTAYADRAIQLAGTFVSQGVGAVEGDSGFPCRQVLPEVGLTLDWCGDRLSAAQRSTWLDALEAQCRWVWPETNPSRKGAHGLWVSSNYFWGFMMTLLGGCALLPERPFGQTLVDQAVARFKSTATPRMQPGGAWEGAYLEEGTSYSYGSLLYMAQSLGAYFSSTGELPWPLIPNTWIPALIRATIHLTTPDLRHLYPGGDQARVSNAPVSDYTMAALLPLLGWATPEDAGMARFWIDQVYANRDRVSSVAWQQLLFYPDLPAIDYRTRLGTFYSMSGVGVFSSRSDWTPNAVQVVGVGGPVRDNDHDDDTGTFFLQRGGDALAGFQKMWSSDGGLHKSVALNSITIDGKSQPGKQDGTHVLLSQDTPAATQWAADLTAAYPSDLNEWRRDLLFLKSQGILVVLDRVNTKNASAAKRFLLHIQQQPTLGTGTYRATAGGSTLFGTSLLPTNASITQEKLSTGSYRINIKSPGGKGLEYFLQVLEAAPSSQGTPTRVVLGGIAVAGALAGNVVDIGIGSQITVECALDATSGPALRLAGNTPPPPPPAQNQPPVARAGGPYSGVVGQPVQFDGSGSSDPDGTIAAWRWAFGDTTFEGAKITRLFENPGTYPVTLTVTDDRGATNTATTTATITAAPAPPTSELVSLTVSATANEIGASYSGAAITRGPSPSPLARGSVITVTVKTLSGQSLTTSTTIEGTTPEPPPLPNPPALLLADDFSGSILAPLWMPQVVIVKPSVSPQGATVAKGSGVLTITPAANASTKVYAGILSAQAFDFTGAQATVEVKEASKGSSNTMVALVANQSNFYLYETEDGQLFATQVVAGMRSQVGTFYSATAHRFWRIRHDAASDKIWWETSADGATWTARRTMARAFAVTGLRLQIACGTWNQQASPGRAVFESVRVERA